MSDLDKLFAVQQDTADMLEDIAAWRGAVIAIALCGLFYGIVWLWQLL